MRWNFVSILICCCSLVCQIAIAQIPQLDDSIVEPELQEEWNSKVASALQLREIMADEELRSNYFNKSQAKAISDWLMSTGEMLDLLELQAMPEFSYSDFLRLQQLIAFDSKMAVPEVSKVEAKLRIYHVQRADQKYSSQPLSIYQKIKWQGTNLEIGLAAETDYGESFKPPPMLHDHRSAYLAIRSRRTKLIVGNYKIFHAQGQTLGQGYMRNSIGSSRIQVAASNSIVPMADNNESNYMLGFAVISRLRSMETQFFLSQQKVDANTSGYHRSASELRNASSVPVQELGISLQNSGQKLSFQSMLLVRNSKPMIDLQLNQYDRNQYRMLNVFASYNRWGLSLSNSIALGKNQELVMALHHQHQTTQGKGSVIENYTYAFKVNFFINKRTKPWQSFYFLYLHEQEQQGFNLTKRSRFQPEMSWQENLLGAQKIIARLRWRTTQDPIYQRVSEEWLCSVHYSKELMEHWRFDCLLQTKNFSAQHFSQQLRLEKTEKRFSFFAQSTMVRTRSSIPLYQADGNFVLPGQQMAFYQSGNFHSLGFRIKVNRNFDIKYCYQGMEFSEQTGIKTRHLMSIRYHD